ncbi:Ppx/GppA family phosphatase [Pseudohoeflea suaedae]|uniref:Ppx/GppA family phosphatase n=1 Tax=Pseudohoeflea suaedae TaxID=877384 RepID=A0A4R5PSI3_9HYPH|nr:Ppx/GppA family phosphatase [Pseudohoeflea suaedae]
MRNGKASSASASRAAAEGTGQDAGGNASSSTGASGGTPSSGAHAPASPNSWKAGKKRRRRRRGRDGASPKSQTRSAAPASAAPGAVVPGAAGAGDVPGDAGPHGRSGEPASRSAPDARSSNSSGANKGASTSESQAPSKSKRRRRRGRGGDGKLRELQGHTLPANKEKSGKNKPRQPGAAGNVSRDPADRAASQRGRSDTARQQDDDLYAALDLGTNNCRLLIAQPTRPGQFRVVDAFSRIVRLGEGLAATGRLSDEAMERSVEALKVCAAKIAGRKLRLKRLIATEACRAAENGPAFLDRVREETGLDLEIVDRETEARLAVAGCSSLIDRGTDGLVLFDIGGGSSEIALIDLSENRTNRLSDHIRAWTSLPMGVVTLSERYGGGTVTRETFDAMVADVESHLAAFMPQDLPSFFSGDGDARYHLLGTSGTVTTLAGLHLELPRYDRRKVDGVWLSRADVDTTLERLLSWNFNERAANPCIGADRADLVLAGCAILEAIRKRWPSERMRVADRGLREGLLNEMMGRDGAWRRAGRRYRARMRAGSHGEGNRK